MCEDIYLHRQELLHRHNNISAQISDKLITQKNTFKSKTMLHNIISPFSKIGN